MSEFPAMLSTPASLFQFSSQIGGLVAELSEIGISIEMGDDFAAYRRFRAQASGRGSIYPMFDIASSYIDQTNGFWICGFDQNGDLLHTQAARLLDLSNHTLGSHLDEHRHKYSTPSTTLDPDRTYFCGPRALDRISGKVCYHGEFWLRPQGLGGARSLGATSLLSELLLKTAATSWDIDYFFGLVPKRLAAKGAHLRYGYSHCEHGKWIGPVGEVTDEDYLIWMEANEMLEQPAKPPFRQLHRFDQSEHAHLARGYAQEPQLVMAGE